MGPPSSGGALLINMLNMLELYGKDSLEWNSSDYVHILTEIDRRAYADRAEHMGDPDYWDVPLEMFRSKEYAKGRTIDIDINNNIYKNLWNFYQKMIKSVLNSNSVTESRGAQIFFATIKLRIGKCYL